MPAFLNNTHQPEQTAHSLTEKINFT